MSTEVPPAAPAANPTHPAPMAPPIGNFVAKSKESLAKHDRNAVPTAAPAATPPAEPPKSPMGETATTTPATPAATDKPTDKSADKPADTSIAPEPPEVFPETITSAKAEDWKRLKTNRDHWETQAKELDRQARARSEELAKITELRAQAEKDYQTKQEAWTKERDEISKQRDEYSALVERHAIETHPSFKAHFQTKLDQAIESAKSAAGAKADQVVSILEAPPSKWRDSAIDALYAEMEQESKKYAMAAAIQRYDETRAERAKTLDNYKEENKKLKLVEAEREADRKKQQAAALENAIQEGLKVAITFDSFKNGDAVEANETTLKKTYRGETPREEYMKLIAQGIDYPYRQKEITELKEKVKELQAAVTEYQGANPGMRTGTGEQANAPATKKMHYGDSPFMAKAISALQRGPGK